MSALSNEGVRRPVLRRTAYVRAALALCAAVLLSSFWLIWAAADADGLASQVTPSDFSQERKATDLLGGALTPARLAAAEGAANAALRIAPTHAGAWIDLAFVDSVRNGGRLSAVGLKALQKSYDFEPLGPDVSPWRLKFDFEHWDQLTPELRTAAIDEAAAAWISADGEGAQALVAMPDTVLNPAGRIAATLVMASVAAPKPAAPKPATTKPHVG